MLGKSVISFFKTYADFFDGCAAQSPPYQIDSASTAAAAAWGFDLAHAAKGACPAIETQPHFAYLNMASYQLKLSLMNLAESAHTNGAQSFDFFATKCATSSPFGDWYTVATHTKVPLLDSQCQLHTFAFTNKMIATLDHYLGQYGQKTTAYDAAAFNMYWHRGDALASKMAQLAQMLDKSHELLTKTALDGKCSMVNVDDVITAEQRLENHHERETFAFHQLAFQEVDSEFHTMYACIVAGGALPTAALADKYYVAPTALPATATLSALSAELGITVTIESRAPAYPSVAMGAALVHSFASVVEFNAKGSAPTTLGAPIESDTVSYAECVAAAHKDRAKPVGTSFHFFPYDAPSNNAPGVNCYWSGAASPVDKPEIRAFALKTVGAAAALPPQTPRAHLALSGQFSGVDCQRICDKVEACEAFVLRVDSALTGHCYMFNSHATTLPVSTGFVGATFGYPSWGAGAQHNCDIKLAAQSFDIAATGTAPGATSS